jgi:hypothetical protein
VTAQTLYESPAVQAVVTAVVGGAVLIEIVVQVSARLARPTTPPVPPEDAFASQDRDTTDVSTEIAIEPPDGGGR